MLQHGCHSVERGVERDCSRRPRLPQVSKPMTIQTEVMYYYGVVH